jgi:hypothetical protein
MLYLREAEISTGLSDRGAGIGTPAEKIYYSTLHHFQKDSAVHIGSYYTGTWVFLGLKRCGIDIVQSPQSKTYVSNE